MRFVRNTLAAVGALLLVILCTPVVKWSAYAFSDRWGRDDAEVLVVLGGSMLTPGTGPNAALGEDTYLRCVVAASMAQARNYRYIVVTGADGLAGAMQKLLVSRGVDPAHILQENAAHSTRENALFTKRILETKFKTVPPVVVLTSDFHSRRARLTFEHVGFIADSIPAPDLIKRSGFASFRVEGFAMLIVELIKFASYKLKGYA